MEFIGRKKELKQLESFYNSEKFEFGYIYGRRRIGKSTLMEMFLKGKKSLSFFATDSEDIINRKAFSNDFSEQTNLNVGVFDDWYSFFKAVDSYFQDEKGVFFIDEYPSILLTRDGKRKNSDFATSLQKAIDILFKKRKITIILTGSNVSFIEKEINKYNYELYQRHTFSLKLKKLNFIEALEAFKDIKDVKEKARFLILTNTFPLYITAIDKTKSFDENLDLLFYNESALFSDDPSKIITSDISSSGLYASIIYAISINYNNAREIANYLEEDVNKIYKYINELIENDVLIKRTSFKSKRNITYEIVDPMLAFYYRFIRGKNELIKSGYGKIIKKRDKNAINNFIEHYFEKLCITYLEYLNRNGLLEGFYENFENFNVENNVLLNRSVEIDIVGEDNDNLLVSEVKFSSSKKGKNVYFHMLENISIKPFSDYENKYLYIFSASGFDDSLKEIDDKNLHLIDLKTMFNEN